MTKADLQGYRALCREIEQIKEIMQRMQEEITGLRATQITGMPRAAPIGTDRIGEAIARYLEASQSYADKLDVLIGQRMQIEAAIASLPPRERELMRCRYMYGMPWSAICTRMGYERRQMHNIHAAALQAIADK